MRFLVLLFLVAVAGATSHPRLLLTAEDESRLQLRLKNDPLMATIHGIVVQRATEMLDERTCQYLIPDGRRLLAESRRAFRNILYCGMAWRTTGEDRFRDRVIRELEAAAGLRNWNPSHFLDTAEMAAAVALGYDWLRPTLTPDQRRKYEDALIEKALTAVPLKYGKTPWWFREARSNWSQVCSAGISLAADAVREREPELAARIFADTSRMLQECGELYLPHGGYAEGPGYWHYGTNYHLIGLAVAQSSGNPLPAPDILKRTGDFILQLNGPTGKNFNFADGYASKKLPSPAQSWIASHFDHSHQAAVIRDQLQKGWLDSEKKPGGYFPLHLLWLPRPSTSDATPALTDRFSGEQAIAMARTGWQAEDAWLALKGGTGAVSHGHLDAGSFIYEASGVRWFHDMGADNYNLPGYFHGDRWQYFRLQNKSHNTLVIDERLQAAPAAGCPLTPWVKKGPLLALEADLTTAYPGQAKEVIRQMSFDPGDGSVVVQDEIKEPVGPVRWAVVTKAEVTIEGQRVILIEDGKRLLLEQVGAREGAWQEFSLDPPKDRENQNEGYRMVGFLAEPSDSLTLKVKWHLE